MTPFIKKKDIKKDWYLINASNAAVGRLAAYISLVLRGKNKVVSTLFLCKNLQVVIVCCALALLDGKS